MSQLGESSAIVSELPAFPGCEGFGCKTPGGRGGRVIEVTNLNDTGPGSLRAAIEADGPRIIVFRTGGTITLDSTLEINNPFLTIAGQTAPGGGIALKIDPLYHGPAIWIHTHDVVIRYLRVRPGFSGQTDVSNLSAIRMSNDAGDVYNIVLDHVSSSWAIDETFSTWKTAHDITIQWSIISESLSVSNTSSSFGGLFGYEAGSENLSIHHNLFAHNSQRNPFVDVPGVVDIVNNVLYNTDRHIDLRNTNGTPLVNIVGNYQKAGSNTKTGRGHMVNSGVYVASIYVQDNISYWRPDDSGDELAGIVRTEDFGEVIPNRHPAPQVTTKSAFEAYEQVLAGAGATLPMRDAVDKRIINDVINGTGKIIGHPDEVGGWPELAAGTPPPDNDHDGMPDDWEAQYGFDPNNPADGSADADDDGYTNVEEFLNNPETPFGPMTLGIDGPASVVPGETFQASVVTRDITNDGLYGVQLEINYDPSLISASNLQVNPNLTFVVLNSADNTSGKIRLVASQQGNVSGLTGDVTLLTFDATAAQNPGTVIFTFENEKFSDPYAQGLEFLTKSYTVSIDEIPALEPTQEPTTEPTIEPTPNPTQEPTPNPTQEPTPNPTSEPTIAVVFGQVILAGRAGNDWSDAIVVINDSSQTGTTDTNGNYSILDVAPGVPDSIMVNAHGYLPAVCTQPTVVAPETALATIALLSGDINDDSLVDIIDATAVGAGFGQTGPDMMADINRDQILDIFDIVLVSVNYGAQGPQTWSCKAI